LVLIAVQWRRVWKFELISYYHPKSLLITYFVISVTFLSLFQIFHLKLHKISLQIRMLVSNAVVFLSFAVWFWNQVHGLVPEWLESSNVWLHLFHSERYVNDSLNFSLAAVCLNKLKFYWLTFTCKHTFRHKSFSESQIVSLLKGYLCELIQLDLFGFFRLNVKSQKILGNNYMLVEAFLLVLETDFLPS